MSLNIREDLALTTGGLVDRLEKRASEFSDKRETPAKIKFDLAAEKPVISIGKDKHPATQQALVAFGNLLQLPEGAVKRIHNDLPASAANDFFQSYLNAKIAKDVKVVVGPGGFISDVSEWSDKKTIQPLDLARSSVEVLGAKSPVFRLVDQPGNFSFDSHVDVKGGGKGIVEDGSAIDVRGKKVGDVTAGGLRWGLDMKHGLAPTVDEVLYRLVCTNGMTTTDFSLSKIDGRGQTVEEIMAEINVRANFLFGQTEEKIKHFYELRNTPVANPERAINTIAEERGLNARSVSALNRLARGEDLPDNPTMFDIVNLVTNFANSPSMIRDGGRLLLENAGGAVITDHASRCGHCAQKVE